MTDLPTKSKNEFHWSKNDNNGHSPSVEKIRKIKNFENNSFHQVFFLRKFFNFLIENLIKISDAKVLGTLLPVSLGSSHSRGSHRTSHYGFVGCPTECACKINEEKNIIADCSDKELGAIPKFKNDIKTRLIRL